MFFLFACAHKRCTATDRPYLYLTSPYSFLITHCSLPRSPILPLPTTKHAKQVYITALFFSTTHPSPPPPTLLTSSITMAPRKPVPKPSVTAAIPTKTSGDRVAKRKYTKVRRHESGLLDVERKTGKYLKM